MWLTGSSETGNLIRTCRQDGPYATLHGRRQCRSAQCPFGPPGNADRNRKDHFRVKKKKDNASRDEDSPLSFRFLINGRDKTGTFFDLMSPGTACGMVTNCRNRSDRHLVLPVLIAIWYDLSTFGIRKAFSDGIPRGNAAQLQVGDQVDALFGWNSFAKTSMGRLSQLTGRLRCFPSNQPVPTGSMKGLKDDDSSSANR